VTPVTCPTDPASSPAPHWDTGPLNLPAVYAVTVKTNLWVRVGSMSRLNRRINKKGNVGNAACRFWILRCVQHWNSCIYCFPVFPWVVCQPPFQPENGGYACHPALCQRLSHGTVIEYFCEEGYVLKGDYKYLTCQYGEWDSQMKLSCLMEQGNQ